MRQPARLQQLVFLRGVRNLAGNQGGFVFPWITLLIDLAISVILSALTPKAKPQYGPRLDDLKVMSGGYGQPIPWIFGEGRLSGNVIWATDLRETQVETKVATGGRKYLFFGPKNTQTVISYEYDLDLAVLICRGPIPGVKRIRADDLLILDDGVSDYDIVIYKGTDTQDRDPTIVAAKGEADTPAYVRRAYAVFNKFNLKNWANRLPSVMSFEIGTAGENLIPLSSFENQRHTVVLKADKTLWAAGANQQGELGLGSYLDAHSLVQIASAVKTVGVGAECLLYVVDGGQMYAAGNNTYGQYGNGTSTGSSQTFIATHDWDDNLRSIEMNSFNCLALKTDGTVWYWGYTAAKYVRGDGSNANALSPIQVASGVAYVSGCSEASVYIDGGGAVYFTGHELFGAFGRGGGAAIEESWFTVGAWTNVTKILLTVGYTVALKSDGTVWAAGCNFFNQFGDTGLGFGFSAVNGGNPKQIPGVTGIVDIALGSSNVYALDGSGNLWSWGADSEGSNGTGLTGYANPTIILTGVRAMGAREFGGVALKTDGSAYSWGDGIYGQHGDGTTFDYSTPHLMPWSGPSTGGVIASDILNAIADECGLVSGRRDYSTADDTVRGFVMPSRAQGKVYQDQLKMTHFFDLIETDGKHRSYARGGAIEAVIDAGELGASLLEVGGEREGPELSSVGLQDIGLPRRIDLWYSDPAQAYDTVSQTYTRQAYEDVDDVRRVDTTEIMSADEALQTAAKLMYQIWNERRGYQIALPIKRLNTHPAVVVSIPTRNGVQRVRIQAWEHEPFGPIKVTLVQDDPSFLTQILTGQPVTPQTSTVYQAGQITLVLFSLPALFDDDADAVGFYYARSAGGDGLLYVSQDGTNYEEAADILDTSIAGTATTVLAAGSETALFDDTNKVRVSVTGKLTSVSDAHIFAGANPMLIGNEYLNYGVATLISVTDSLYLYELSHLLRGQRGTDVYWGSHLVGDRVLVLGAGTKRVEFPDTFIGSTIYLKAVPTGKELEDVIAQTLLLGGDEFSPWTVGNVVVTADGADNLSITWNQRPRKGGIVAPWSDPPTVDLPETYRLSFYTDSGFTTLASNQPKEVTSPSFLYSAAAQTADGLTPGGAVYFKIYQVGAKLGTGFVKVIDTSTGGGGVGGGGTPPVVTTAAVDGFIGIGDMEI